MIAALVLVHVVPVGDVVDGGPAGRAGGLDVDQFAGLSDWKKDFLKSDPILTLGHIAPVASKIYHTALAGRHDR